jgi:hypothetical protein
VYDIVASSNRDISALLLLKIQILIDTRLERVGSVSPFGPYNMVVDTDIQNLVYTSDAMAPCG